MRCKSLAAVTIYLPLYLRQAAAMRVIASRGMAEGPLYICAEGVFSSWPGDVLHKALCSP